MLKPNDWEDVTAYNNTPALPPGGYVCNIIKLEEKESKNTGKNVLYIQIDIAEGEYYQYYLKQFMRSNSQEPKWRGMVYVATQDRDGHTLPNFKGFIESIEASNEGWSPAWGNDSAAFCDSFKDKKVGIVFGREQFRSDRNGKVYWQTKQRFFNTVDEIRNGDFNVPDDKYLDGEEAKKENEKITHAAESAGFTAVEDDDDVSLPF